MDQLKAAFGAARGGILPKPTDEEWQALLEWSRLGSMPPHGAISYAKKCWNRYRVPPPSLTPEKVLRLGERITGLDLAGHSCVFRREMLHQFDRLAAIVREQHGLLPANHYTHGRPKKRGDTWVGDLWLLSVEFVIAEVLGRTIGGVDRGFELPWETINPGCIETLRIVARREAGKKGSPHKGRILAFKRSTPGPTEARVVSDTDGALGDHIPRSNLGPNGPHDPDALPVKDDTKRLQLGNAGPPNANQLSGEPIPADGLQLKPIDPQLTRTSVKDMLKALELIDSNWDDYHKQLVSTRDEMSALRVEVVTKSKQLEEYEQQASARLAEMDGLREKLEAQSCQLDQEKRVREQVQRGCNFLYEAMAKLGAENARIKKDLDQVLEAYRKREAEKAWIKQELYHVLATYCKRDAELASSVATIGSVLRTDGPFPPASECQVTIKKEEM